MVHLAGPQIEDTDNRVILKDRLIQLIQSAGPIPVSAYMSQCLHDPKDGYYATRPGLGADFITAPEASQVFGELLGLWSAHEWIAMGSPSRLCLLEVGPGRGVLMADALRAARHAKGFMDAKQLYFTEASPAMRQVIRSHLNDHSPVFVSGVEQLYPGPVILLANEFLDCLPVRQFVKSKGAWHERVVGLNGAGALSFGLAADQAPELPATPLAAVEVQPGLDMMVDALKARVENGEPLRALFIDYGPANAAPDDTLRAYKAGEQIHPLAQPGRCDLTVDVDFGRLKRLALAAGLDVAGPVSQGAFLGAIGVQERLDALLKSEAEKSDEIFKGANKLVDPDQMGLRFKVICISSPGLPPPAGFGL